MLSVDGCCEHGNGPFNTTGISRLAVQLLGSQGGLCSMGRLIKPIRPFIRGHNELLGRQSGP
jgi:hypothetical protein